jgi:hypothetical protein
MTHELVLGAVYMETAAQTLPVVCYGAISSWECGATEEIQEDGSDSLIIKQRKGGLQKPANMKSCPCE